MTAETADVPPQVVDPRVMRDVLGHFASGVTVVTAMEPEGPIGFTCQSFSSLSLDPPLIAFCPSRTSTTWPRLREVGRFCVNVLAEDQSDLSQAFARSGTDKYAGVAWAPSPQGSPMLDGVVAWIDSEVWAEYEGGDHTIVVGRVVDLSADESRSPLVFHRGSYGLQAALEAGDESPAG